VGSSTSERGSSSSRLTIRDIIPDGSIINKCIFANNVRVRK
jgi:hypothetical protein